MRKYEENFFFFFISVINETIPASSYAVKAADEIVMDKINLKKIMIAPFLEVKKISLDCPFRV
jgi:hypothetical protein